MPTLNPIVHTLLIGLVSSALTVSAYAQQGTAVDVLATDIASFINALPRDAVSDRPIRVVDVGDYRVGVYGVFRPKDFLGGANLHRVETTEIYYIIKGTGTLVTGGQLSDPVESPTNLTSLRGSGVEHGISRRIGPGDVVVIPGHTAHWWSAIDSDIEHLIFRPDPDNRIPLQ
jgi:mannose-6-phosphate isomerase-like protein (cupin superfamily)